MTKRECYMKRILIILFFVLFAFTSNSNAFISGSPNWEYIMTFESHDLFFDRNTNHIRDLGNDTIMFNLGVKDKNSPLLYVYKTIVSNASTPQPQGRFSDFYVFALKHIKLLSILIV